MEKYIAKKTKKEIKFSIWWFIIPLLSLILFIFISKNNYESKKEQERKELVEAPIRVDKFIKRVRSYPNCVIDTVELSEKPMVFYKNPNQVCDYTTGLDPHFHGKIFVRFDENSTWFSTEDQYTVNPEDNYSFWMKSDEKVKIIIAIYDVY